MRAFALLVLICASLFGSSGVTAQGPAPGSPSAVAMRDVDRACVRVIAVYGAQPFVFDSIRTRARRLLAEPVAGHGTGFYVDGAGIVATAAHVVAGAHFVGIIPAGDDVARPARVLYVDPVNDVAFLEAAGPVAAVVGIPTADPVLAATDPVVASGFPLDVRERFPAAVEGIVGRENNDGSIYTTIAVNPGNSGGPVTTARGELIGLVSRGSNLRAGAQGFGIVEPVRFVRVGLANARAFAAMRAEPVTPADVALARVAADLIGTDTEARYFERTPYAVFETARSALRTSESAMLVSVHAWNVHIALLERHGVRDVAQLPADVRSVAHGLRQMAVTVMEDAVARSPYLVVSFPFARSLSVQGNRSYVLRTVE